MASILNILGSACISATMYYKLSSSSEFIEFTNLIKEHGFDGYTKHSITTIIKTFLYNSHCKINYDNFEDGMTYDDPKQNFKEYLEQLFINVLSRLNIQSIKFDNNDTLNTYIDIYIEDSDITSLLDGPIDIEKIHDFITLSIVGSIMDTISELQIEKLFENNDENEMLFLGLVKICMAYLNKNVRDSVNYDNNNSDDDSNDDDTEIVGSPDKEETQNDTNKRNNNDVDNDITDNDTVQTKKQKN